MAYEKLSIIFCKHELQRIQITQTTDGQTSITADLHGMKCYEAKRFINNIINVMQAAFILNIIHGYNNGTAIKDMIDTNYNNKHVYAKYQDKFNQGMTHMFVSA